MSDTQKTRIQNRLVALALAGQFHKVTYDGTTHVASVNTDQSIAPGFVAANEIQSVFETDREYGRSLRTRRSDWVFELLMNFPCEVSLDAFEASFSTPPVLPRENGFDQAAIMLVRTSVKHPIEQNSLQGTQAIFAFQILLGRI